MKYNRAITLVEALVGVAIIGIILVFVIGSQELLFRSARQSLETTKATYLAEEGQEYLRYMRDADWNQLKNLSTNTTYYFYRNGGTIVATTTPQVIDAKYTRSFVLKPLMRDSNNDLTSSGGTSDAGGRIATVRVDWSSTYVSLDAIVSNIHNI